MWKGYGWEKGVQGGEGKRVRVGKGQEWDKVMGVGRV